MTTYSGGTRVSSGYYIDAKSYAFVNVETDGTALPGGADRRYLKIPVMAVMAAAPALGGLFVVALPFIGVGMTAYGLARRLGGAARSGAKEIAATLAAPAPAPGEAHLTGGPPTRTAAPDKVEGTAASAPPPQAIEALEKEIEKQRGVIH